MSSQKRILVIDDSSLFRNFLEDQFLDFDFEIIHGLNGLDGFNKMRSEDPDLIIMDYYLTRKSSMEILEYKAGNANFKDIPVVMTAGAVDKTKILEIAQMGVRKILHKPVKIDTMLKAIAEVLRVSITLDDTPCLLDAHLNDKILFVELAQGFNQQKINILKYKIAELIKLYEVRQAKILILMTDIVFQSGDQPKLDSLVSTCLDFVDKADDIRILTTSDDIKEYITKNKKIQVPLVDDLTQAMDGLFGVSGLESLTAEQDNVQDTFFSSKKELLDSESFQLNFEGETGDGKLDLSDLDKSVNIAVVDDDFIVQSIVETALKTTNFNIHKFSNGADFISSLENVRYDLVFLDLMMPGMNGFAVLQFLSTNKEDVPVIVLSAMTRKESVQKAMDFGIRSYIIKPVKPENIIRKSIEVLKMNF